MNRNEAVAHVLQQVPAEIRSLQAFGDSVRIVVGRGEYVWALELEMAYDQQLDRRVLDSQIAIWRHRITADLAA